MTVCIHNRSRKNWWYILFFQNYSFLHLSAKACERKEWESRAISRWMCGFGPPSSFFFFPPSLIRRPYIAADISESYQTTKPLRFRDAILIVYKHENYTLFFGKTYPREIIYCKSTNFLDTISFFCQML